MSHSNLCNKISKRGDFVVFCEDLKSPIGFFKTNCSAKIENECDFLKGLCLITSHPVHHCDFSSKDYLYLHPDND